MDQNLQQFILKLPEFFLPDRSSGICVTAQLNLQDNPSDYWTLEIKNQHCEVRHEKSHEPQFELTASPADLLDILSGKLKVGRAYMQGKLIFRGNFRQAAKLVELFDIPDDIQGKIIE